MEKRRKKERKEMEWNKKKKTPQYELLL